jgi:large subunit ribosomal protein L23
MALFSRKQNKKEVKQQGAAPAVQAAAASRPSAHPGLANVLAHARITEKASMVAGAGVYTFDISESATKRDIMQAVKALYGVSPRKVAVVTVKSKTRRNARTGKSGIKKGGRKAYVYLKSGETITIA